METKTLELIINAFSAAMNNATRFHMEHVVVSVSGDKIEIKATDGYILSQVKVSDPAAIEVLAGQKPQYFHRDQVKELKVLAKEFKKSHLIPSATVAGALCLNGAIKASTDISYPETKQLWPNKTEQDITIKFNPDLLSDLADALKTDKRQSGVTLRFNPNNPHGAILVTVNDDGEGLLMPMRR